jgi:hypothetical protein
MRRERGDEADVLWVYGRILVRWPKTIAVAMLLAAALTGFVSKFYLAKWYKATTVIRPVSQAALQEQLTGLESAFASGGSGISGVLGSISGGASGGNDADEFVGILNSFTFMRSLIIKHNLIANLLADEKPSMPEFQASRHLQWLAYRRMQNRFDVDYAVKTGNITLELQEMDPEQAETVMGYIVDDFRKRLREKQLRDVRAAINSLNDEAAHTSDPTLQGELYQLIADQIQREKLAEVQSDFAFTIIEAPSASDMKVWPPTALLSLLAALVTFVLVAGCILLFAAPGAGEAPVLLTPTAVHQRGGEERQSSAVSQSSAT